MTWFTCGWVMGLMKVVAFVQLTFLLSVQGKPIAGRAISFKPLISTTPGVAVNEVALHHHELLYSSTVSNHSSLPSKRDAKRLTDAEWRHFVGSGCNLVQLMEADISSADTQLMTWKGIRSQSRWTNYADLETFGWNRDDHTKLIRPDWFSTAIPIQSALDALGINNQGTQNGGSTQMISWAHEREWQDNPPTEADYTNLFNTRDGVIYAYSNFGPANTGPEQEPPVDILPDLKQWSDVLWLEWDHLASPEGHLRNIRHVFRTPIDNADTRAIINRVLANKGIEGLQSFDAALTLGMDEDEGKALLASPNGNGIAWFLINHKNQLGLKRVREVKVFYSDKPDDPDNDWEPVPYKPSLLFIIEDV